MKRYRYILLPLMVFAMTIACTQDEDLITTDSTENPGESTLGDPENEANNPTEDPTDDTTEDSSEESTEDSSEEGSQSSGCTDASSYVFLEANALLMIEFEDGAFEDGAQWELISDEDASGGVYAVWEGNNNFNAPGSGLVTFRLSVQNPGVYRFTWKSAVTQGDNGTEHNDSWLRFPDAADFYGEKNGSKVYPKDTGKTPNPNGSSKEGWFKVYRSGNDLDFKWQARTSDNDAHDIYVEFAEAGEYTMEVSGRSEAHAIDQFVLYQEVSYTKNEATAVTAFSEIDCD